MLKFNDYLNEEFDEILEIDTEFLENNMETMNAELDALTERPYKNAPVMLNQLRGLLNRYGLMLPDSANMHFLSMSAELVYMLGESNLHLYIVFDTNDDGFVDGYAQIVTDDELEDLVKMNTEDLVNSDRDPIAIRPSTWYAKYED
jgi:hypothetical protein